MFPASPSGVFGIGLLSLLLLTQLSTPAASRQLSQVSSVNHPGQCILSQPSEHLAIRDGSLSPRDYAGNTSDRITSPLVTNYWNFYPYTTAIRSLRSSEHRFFGPLGSHTRDPEQRKTDQTYIWYIPKKTHTVSATETLHKAAMTETHYKTTTETAAVISISWVTTTVVSWQTVKEREKVAMRIGENRPYPIGYGSLSFSDHQNPLTPSVQITTWSNQAAIRHSEEIKTRKHPYIPRKLAVFKEGEMEKSIQEVISTAEDNDDDTTIARETASAVQESNDGSANFLEAAVTTEASDGGAIDLPEATFSQQIGNSSAIASSGPLNPLFYDNVIVAVAQIAGFIMVGIALAALVVLILVWCSQPLWWPCKLKRKRSKTVAMQEAQNDVENVQAETDAATYAEANVQPRVEFVSAPGMPGAMDGNISEDRPPPDLPWLAASATGSSRYTHGSSARRAVSGSSVGSPIRAMPGSYRNLESMFDRSPNNSLPQ